MLVVHGVWRSGVGLAVWAEDSALPADAPRRPGRAPRERPHPFAADQAALVAALAATAEPAHLGTALLTLPTRAGAPLDSPELVRADVAGPVRGPVTLAGWRVPVLWYAPDAALALLRGVDAVAAVPGATLRHLAELADFAVDLAARGRVLPGLAEAPPTARARAGGKRAEAGARAVWRPLLTGTDAAWARALALALPPAARAATGPDEPGDPGAAPGRAPRPDRVPLGARDPARPPDATGPRRPPSTRRARWSPTRSTRSPTPPSGRPWRRPRWPGAYARTARCRPGWRRSPGRCGSSPPTRPRWTPSAPNWTPGSATRPAAPCGPASAWSSRRPRNSPSRSPWCPPTRRRRRDRPGGGASSSGSRRRTSRACTWTPGRSGGRRPASPGWPVAATTRRRPCSPSWGAPAGSGPSWTPPCVRPRRRPWSWTSRGRTGSSARARRCCTPPGSPCCCRPGGGARRPGSAPGCRPAAGPPRAPSPPPSGASGWTPSSTTAGRCPSATSRSRPRNWRRWPR